MTSPIIDEELALLQEVTTLLEEEPWEVPPREDDLVAELVRLREELPAAKDEDKGALMAQYNAQLSLLEQLRATRDREQVDPASPYFAHLRLKEGKVVRDLCLGKATRIQRGVRIVDWRNAPVSRLFYRYRQGEEYEEEFGNKVLNGEVLARRTVTIRRGELERVDSPEGVFVREADGWRETPRSAARLRGGEGAAMQVYKAGEGEHRRLGTSLQGHRRRADKRLPDIAGLIDEEQFELITQPTSGFVVIRGTAGSGKTTVALHRIAWMAYEQPNINSDRTMFIVFSRALRDYVGHVLPSLGVERVGVTTFHEWARKQRERHFPRLPRKRREDTPSWVVKIKMHPAMLAALSRQVERIDAPSRGEQAVDDWMSVCTDLELLTSCFATWGSGAVRQEELERFTTWCRDRNEELVARLEGDKEVSPELDEEDDALLLRAWQLRVGPLRAKGRSPLIYRHIAIDEVQDFSPLEVRVLLECLDKKQSITLAGDTQQHVMQDAGFTSWADFFASLGVDGVAVNTLRVSYRSSAEIVNFAMGILGDLREDDMPLTTRHGPAPELFRFTDHGGAVAFLADALTALLRDEPLASVAVLTPNAEISRIYHQGLDRGEVPRLRRVTQQDFSFAPGVEITEVSQVKGLEFDYVVVVEASAQTYPDSPGARRLLHVAATRAVHQLWLTSVAEPSPIVTEAMAFKP